MSLSMCIVNDMQVIHVNTCTCSFNKYSTCNKLYYYNFFIG